MEVQEEVEDGRDGGLNIFNPAIRIIKKKLSN